MYTKQIVGYKVSDHMRAEANISALRMAIDTHGAPEYHHSDRGRQYISKKYLRILKKHKCNVSMAISAQDNAYAERIHRTLKEEYLDYWMPNSLRELKRCVTKAVRNYNEERPHNNLNRLSPGRFNDFYHHMEESLRPAFSIFDYEKYCLKTVNTI